MDLKRVEITNHGLASATLTTQQRAEYLDALQSLAPFGASLREAVEVGFSFLGSRSQSLPVKDAAAKFIEGKRGEGRSGRYLQDLKTRLNAFGETFGGRRVSELSAPRLSASTGAM